MKKKMAWAFLNRVPRQHGAGDWLAQGNAGIINPTGNTINETCFQRTGVAG